MHKIKKDEKKENSGKVNKLLPGPADVYKNAVPYEQKSKKEHKSHPPHASYECTACMPASLSLTTLPTSDQLVGVMTPSLSFSLSLSSSSASLITP